jgi:hypothetical protein
VSSSGLPKQLIIFAIVLPLALVVGYLLATPDAVRSMSLVGLLLAGLSIPIFLRWHYGILIFAWNANITLILLPGKPSLWMPLAGISLGITILTCVLDKQVRFQHVPSVTLPLMFLLLVVLATTKLTGGGIGLRALGSGVYGGKKLVFILAAVIGYFALSSHRIVLQKASNLTAVFFLSSFTSLASNLIYIAGPTLYFLYLIFPVDNALGQAYEDFTTVGNQAKFGRIPGAAAAGLGAFYFLLMRYGLKGLCTRAWRVLLAAALVGISMLGGFRSAILVCGLVCAAQFYFERLFRTRLFVAALLGLVLAGAALVPFAQKLPLSVQRTLSFLPLEIDPAARASAEGSLQWRMEMWKVLWTEVPRYFWIGKGYAISPTDLYFADEGTRRGVVSDYEGALVAGDYHSGPLSVLIPFGIFGMMGFVWFLIAGIRLLYRNYLYSPEELRNINTFFLCYFVAKAVFYFVGFGALNVDLQFFAGILALSIAINGGMRQPEPALEPKMVPVALPAPAAA